MPNPVLAAVVAHLRLESETGGYEAAEEEIDRIKAAYDAVGAIIGSPTRNVGIVENATVAVAQALSAYDFRPDDVIVTSRAIILPIN